MIYQTYLRLYTKLPPRLRKFLSSTLLFAAITGVAMLGYTTIEFTRVQREGDLAQSIMIQAEALKFVLIDAETGQRGYIITGDDRFLEPTEASRVRFPGQINALKGAMGEIAFNETNILLLANEKMAELAKTIEMRRSLGFEQARDYVASYIGKQIMDSIRNIVQDVESRETQVVLTSSRHARQLGESMVFLAILVLSCFVALILFPWGIEPVLTQVAVDGAPLPPRPEKGQQLMSRTDVRNC